MQLSPQAECLFKPKRYKIFYGGRGGTKSWDFAGALLVMGAQRKLFIVCGREVQNSIKQSVHRLLKNRIEAEPSLASGYIVQEQKITHSITGTEIIFVGLRQQSVENIKSLEGADIVWIEEAQTVSEKSLEILIPTVRKAGSEIWASFNPKFESDPIWQLMQTLDDSNSFIRKVSYKDNPWFKDTPLEDERLRMEKADPIAYQHVWEGGFDERFQGYVFASQIKEAIEAERISSVPYKKGVPVHTVWDLGKNDSTSIWFFQLIGTQARFIDFYEANNQELPHYADIIHGKPYSYGRHFLPHDGAHNRLGMVKSVREQLSDMGVRSTTRDIVKAVDDNTGVTNGRLLIAECMMDKDKCADGIHALNNYRYIYDENKKQYGDKPYHDWASHASDAFGKYAPQAIEMLLSSRNVKKPASIAPASRGGGSHGWMG